MLQLEKRGKGKIKGALGIRQMYIYYKNICKEPIEYKLFSKIIKLSNKELVNQIVNNSEIVDLPYRLGKLQVSKFERSFNQPSNKWAIDFKKSRELGFKVFFDQKYIYKWKWRKHYSVVINKTGYKFEACRTAKRMVPIALKQGVDFFK